MILFELGFISFVLGLFMFLNRNIFPRKRNSQSRVFEWRLLDGIGKNRKLRIKID